MSMQGQEDEKLAEQPEATVGPVDTRLVHELAAVASVSSMNPSEDESASGVSPDIDSGWEQIKPILIGGEEMLADLKNLSDRYDAGEKVSDIVMARGYSLLSVTSDHIRGGGAIMTGVHFDECVTLVNELMKKERILAHYTEVFGHDPEPILTLGKSEVTDKQPVNTADIERLVSEAQVRVLSSIDGSQF